jgi:alpha-beta hydrolase superfamily lysophospholipase
MPIKAKRSIQVLAITALLGCAGVWSVGSLLTRATNGEVAISPFPARLVHIDSTANVRLAGTYWPAARSNAPSILMLHGNGSNRGSMGATAAWLNAQGYAVLAIDFRGHGQSTPAGKSFGLFEADDARAALAWLHRANPGARIGVIGFSLGGAASLLGPQGPLRVDALVLEGVYPDIRHAIANRLAIRLGKWPAAIIEPLLSYQSVPRLGVWPSSISPIRALRQVHEPVMIVGGGEDRNTPPTEAQAMYSAVKTHGELHILAGVGHDDLGRNPPDSFKQALLAFLDRNLRQ